MRETCARVLAAALMTGAIGFALAMPAIFATAHNAGRLLTAPPSSLQRSVHVVASAPSRSDRRGRLEETRPIGPASLLEGGSTPASRRHSTKAGPSERAPKPAPKPTPAPPARELASTTPPATVSSSTPSQPAATPDSKGKGKKKGKQHDKNKGKPTEVPQPPVAAATPVSPTDEPPATEAEKDHGNGNGNGNDNDNDKGKGKSDGKGHNG